VQSVVVAGMHRSGTSLLASLARRAGVDLGSRLMPASKGNPRGHFEDLDFVHFHERLFDRRGAGALTPPRRGSLAPTAAEEAEARALVDRRRAKPLWGFKDPRTTLLLDFWDRLLPAPLYLLVYRHPVEVALSLLRRGLDLEVELDPAAAVHAWTVYNEHLLDFLHAHPERSLLWSIGGATRALAAAGARLGERLGTTASGDEAPEVAYREGEMCQGLAARDIDWSALLPRAMDLYRQLEAAAELPAGSGPDLPAMPRRERDLLDAAEHLLAAALAVPSGAAAVPASLRVAYSDLRLLAAEQEEVIALLRERIRAGEEEARRLAGRLQERDRQWKEVKSTCGWRLLVAYWDAVRWLRGLRSRDGGPSGRLGRAGGRPRRGRETGA
jgi:hypothetical protein